MTFQSVRFADLEKAGANGEAYFVHLGEMSFSKEENTAGPGNGSKNPKSNADSAKPKSELEEPKSREKAMPDEKAHSFDLEAVKKEAHTRGKQEGRAEAEKKLHSTTQALAEALEQISGLRQSLLESSKEDMIRMIMAVSARVIRTGVDEKKEMIVNTVTDALGAAVEADEYYIRVNPEDLETVMQRQPLFLAAMKGLQNIYFIADEKISPGGCVAESRAGDVDATIETQLGEIEEHLRKAVI